jgi:hypothetical protein
MGVPVHAYPGRLTLAMARAVDFACLPAACLPTACLPTACLPGTCLPGT